MRTVILNNGVEMPVLGIGTSMMEEEDCERMVREALDLGYRFIDTAQAYHNEGAVGRAVRQSDVSRRDVFISTKLSVSNTTYEKAKEGCKRSLDRLGVDYIDLLTLQFPYFLIMMFLVPGARLQSCGKKAWSGPSGSAILQPTVSRIWSSMTASVRRWRSSSGTRTASVRI